jgi:hypothetical protein
VRNIVYIVAIAGAVLALIVGLSASPDLASRRPQATVSIDPSALQSAIDTKLLPVQSVKEPF